MKIIVLDHSSGSIGYIDNIPEDYSSTDMEDILSQEYRLDDISWMATTNSIYVDCFICNDDRLINTRELPYA